MGRDTDSSIGRTEIPALKVEDPEGLYQREGYRLGDSLGYLLKRTVAMLSGAIDQELVHYDLTHPQFSILMILHDTNCSTAAELARETCGDTGAITRMLDRLEAKGLVRRVRSAADRRVVNIELTAAGKAAADQMPTLAINVLNRHLQGVNREELETMKQLLRRLLGNGGVQIPGQKTSDSGQSS